jgi:DNA gyrase inhibitor GyrI
MKTTLLVIGILSLLGLTALAVFVFVIQNVEQPSYRALLRDGDFELRDYPPLVVAEVRRQGGRRQALSAGFGPLAGYIFARERDGERIAMTAPVTQIRDEGGWVVRFFMPAGYGTDRLPEPAGSDVRLRDLPAQRVAALRFSGGTGDERLAEKESELRSWLAARGLEPVAEPLYAYYNDPLTPGFLRRNEVMIPVADAAVPTGAASPP